MSVDIAPVRCAHRHKWRNASRRRFTVVGRLPGRDHGLAISNQVELGQPLDHDHSAFDRLMPRQKMTQIIAIAAHGRSGEVFPLEAGDEAGHPVGIVQSRELANCTQCHPGR